MYTDTDFASSDDERDDISIRSSSSVRSSPTPSSTTSHDVSMRSASPAPSVYSVTDSIRAASYRHEFGRGVNNYSEVYKLPADDEELQRLDLQHIMFQKLMGKYAPPLPEVLAEEVNGETKTVLDLGCGSGSWIVDVARDFPHCQAVAVDLIPMQAPDMPDNIRSEVDDVNLGLQHFFGDFNVVHARLISSGIRDYHTLIDHISETLRPGGLVDILEFDFRVYDHNHKPINPAQGSMSPPYFARWMSLLNLAVRQRGGSPDAATMLHPWLSQHHAFEDVVYREYYIPTAPFVSRRDPDYHRQKAIAELFREDIYAFLRSGRPLLLGTGLPEAIVDELQQQSRMELEEGRTVTFVRVENVYARKRPRRP